MFRSVRKGFTAPSRTASSNVSDPPKQNVSDEGGRSNEISVQRTRNECVTLKNWITSPIPEIWFVWPTFPLQTKHRKQNGMPSEALARTYAIQFKLNSFRIEGTETQSATLIKTLRSTSSPAEHFYLSADIDLALPPRQHLDSWKAVQNGTPSTVRMSMTLSADQLQTLFPAHGTNWSVLLQDHNIDMISTRRIVVTSQTCAKFEYVLVVLTGSIKTIWTTAQQYSKMTNETSSYS